MKTFVVLARQLLRWVIEHRGLEKRPAIDGEILSPIWSTMAGRVTCGGEFYTLHLMNEYASLDVTMLTVCNSVGLFLAE